MAMKKLSPQELQERVERNVKLTPLLYFISADLHNSTAHKYDIIMLGWGAGAEGCV